MSRRRPAIVVLLSVLFVAMSIGAPAASAAPPPAPTGLAPAPGAQVVVPLEISWSAIADPTIIGYNWQVSRSSSFSPVIQQDSTGGETRDTVSGLPNGTYFWRVQAANSALQQGAWSPARSFTVTGTGPGQPGSPVLAPPKGGTRFHPFESISFTWSAVPGAASYVFEADKNASFPVGSTRVHFDNISETSTSVVIGDFCGGCEQGNYLARVYAVGANGNRGVPSATIAFSVFYNNPLPPPPTPLAPVNGATVNLPITFSWTDVPNPQGNGYQLQISRNSSFTSIEDDIPLITPSHREVLTLTSGAKFWRVRSFQGDASPTTAAATAWSATARFTVAAAPPAVSAITVTRSSPFSGEEIFGNIQLTAAAPAGGAVVRLTSSNPAALPVPASVTVPAGLAVPLSSFSFQAGQVTSPTPVTLTATLGSSTASIPITVRPPSLDAVILTPAVLTGGVSGGAIVQLNGRAPAGGAAVSLSSSSPAVHVPATVTVAAGDPTTTVSIAADDVATSTPVTITATWKGASVQAQLTVQPSPAPTGLTLFPATTTGDGGSVTGRVTVASAAPTDRFLSVTSDNATVLPFLSSSVLIPANSDFGAIQILPRSVNQTTVVTISVSGGGVTKSAELTVNPDGTPPPAPTLASFTVSPTSVTGGTPATGTVTLPAAAPAGGTVVTLSSRLPGSASVPQTVTVPAGASRVTFPVTTFPVAQTTVLLAATKGDTTLFAALGITVATGPTPSPSPSQSPAPGQTDTLTVTATGRSGERVTSSPSGISATVGTSRSAAFPTGSAVTLTASNGRSAIWSGACSSNGNKTKSCTLTLHGAATVTASVQ